MNCNSSISLVRTPFQLFNCIEAVRNFNKNGENILICIYKKERDKDLYNRVLKEFHWSKVYFFKLNFFNKWFYSFRLNNIIKKYKNTKYCFFGLITSYNIHAINIINAQNNILIDDGNEIFLIVNNLSRQTYVKKFNTNFFNKLLKRNFDLKFLKRLKIFTFFDVDQNLINNEILKNRYIQFKRSIENLPTSNEIFFIGSNLIDTYISQEYFEKILKSTLDYYGNTNIVYIPHRYENIGYLKGLSQKYNFRIKKFSTILELGILEYGEKPNKLISIRSTALETLNFLYDIKSIQVLKLNLDYLLKENQKKEFLDLYENYKMKKIKVIEVDSD